MTHTSVSLGFVAGTFPAGVHVCHVFSTDAERDRALSQFMLAGMRAKERCGCFSDHASRGALLRELEAEGISVGETSDASSALSVANTSTAYFDEGRFEPERMLERLSDFHEQAVKGGYPGARIIGEMTSEIEHVPGGSRLLEYEARVSMMLRKHPITTMCQYDARCFDGASIMDILRVHPFVVIRGAVVENPFYLPPEQFLQQRQAAE